LLSAQLNGNLLLNKNASIYFEQKANLPGKGICNCNCNIATSMNATTESHLKPQFQKSQQQPLAISIAVAIAIAFAFAIGPNKFANKFCVIDMNV